MQIGVRVLRHVVVKDNVDPFDVHASSEEIRSHQDSLAEALKRLVLGKSGQKIKQTLNNKNRARTHG